jgi:hypothetical protein
MLLSIEMATGAQSATAAQPATAAQQPIEEIQNLDEIWVRGKHLSEVIEDAEDDFFKLYNKLNQDQKYDVYCGVMALNSSSMIMIRKCVPGFIVNNSYEYQTNTVSLDSSSFGSSCESVSSDAVYFCGNAGFGYQQLPQYVPPSPQLLAMAQGPAYARNVLKVVTSDPRLLEKVGSLGELYAEMELTQQHYVRIRKSTEPARRGRQSARPYISPRAL